jgi:hypothetical protein
MPGGDRTGPLGQGSRTGRAAGYCSGYPGPGYANPSVPGYGRGFGFGRGRGRGFGRGFWGRGRGFWGRGYYPTPSYGPTPYYNPYYGSTYPEPNKEEEKSYLEDMVKALEGELKAIKERLQELSKEQKE